MMYFICAPRSVCVLFNTSQNTYRTRGTILPISKVCVFVNDCPRTSTTTHQVVFGGQCSIVGVFITKLQHLSSHIKERTDTFDKKNI